MLSALILTGRGYPAVQLAPQPVNQWSVQPGPLVLRSVLRSVPAPATDRDRTVSRRSEPSSRATLIGEQPNPWNLLQPRERSACYPRSTFYPLSDGPPIWRHRITLPWFPTCSTCMSPSQARFCQCTLRTVAIRAERTLGSLRYSFGGDHPSQTALQAVSPTPGVRAQTTEGWYFNSDSAPTGVGTSRSPTYPTHPLPGFSAKIQ